MIAAPHGPPDGHALLVHRSPREHAHALAQWAARGVERGEQVLLETDGATATAAVMDAVEALGVDGAGDQVQVVAAGTVSAAELLTTRRSEALAAGHRGLRVARSAHVALEQLSAARYVEQEAAFERASRELPAATLCCLDLAVVPGDATTRAARHHRHLRGVDVHIQLDLPLVRISGAVDSSGAAATSLALSGLADGEVGSMCVDLTQVSVLSAAGVRVLLRSTEALRLAGGRVVVHTGPAARLVLEAVQLDTQPGFVLQDVPTTHGDPAADPDEGSD